MSEYWEQKFWPNTDKVRPGLVFRGGRPSNTYVSVRDSRDKIVREDITLSRALRIRLNMMRGFLDEETARLDDEEPVVDFKTGKSFLLGELWRDAI